MKANLHPEYGPVTVTCTGCQNTFQTRSAKTENYHVDVCSQCHPYFTGKEKLMDREGRVEKFRNKYGSKAAVDAKAATDAKATEAKAAAAAPKAKA
jgi:large subunit ribosomal protein L31